MFLMGKPFHGLVVFVVNITSKQDFQLFFIRFIGLHGFWFCLFFFSEDIFLQLCNGIGAGWSA